MAAEGFKGRMHTPIFGDSNAHQERPSSHSWCHFGSLLPVPNILEAHQDSMVKRDSLAKLMETDHATEC
jgi:hypothetical protein